MTEAWLEYCRQLGIDPERTLQWMLASGRQMTGEYFGITVKVNDVIPDGVVLFVDDDDGEIVGGITGIGET